jgi:hypothetical protein
VASRGYIVAAPSIRRPSCPLCRPPSPPSGCHCATCRGMRGWRQRLARRGYLSAPPGGTLDTHVQAGVCTEAQPPTPGATRAAEALFVVLLLRGAAAALARARAAPTARPPPPAGLVSYSLVTAGLGLGLVGRHSPLPTHPWDVSHRVPRRLFHGVPHCVSLAVSHSVCNVR